MRVFISLRGLSERAVPVRIAFVSKEDLPITGAFFVRTLKEHFRGLDGYIFVVAGGSNFKLCIQRSTKQQNAGNASSVGDPLAEP